MSAGIGCIEAETRSARTRGGSRTARRLPVASAIARRWASESRAALTLGGHGDVESRPRSLSAFGALQEANSNSLYAQASETSAAREWLVRSLLGQGCSYGPLSSSDGIARRTAG